MGYLFSRKGNHEKKIIRETICLMQYMSLYRIILLSCSNINENILWIEK